MKQQCHLFSINDFELESKDIDQQLRQKIQITLKRGMLEDQEYPIVIWDGYGLLAVPLKAYSLTLKQGIISCQEIQIEVDLQNPKGKYNAFYYFERHEILEGENVMQDSIYLRNKNIVSTQHMEVVKFGINQNVFQNSIEEQIRDKDKVFLVIQPSSHAKDIDISEFNNIQSVEISSSLIKSTKQFILPANLKYLSTSRQFGLFQQISQLCNLQYLCLSYLEINGCLELTNLTKLRTLKIIRSEFSDIQYPESIKILSLENCKNLQLPKCESVQDLTLRGKNFVGTIDCSKIRRIDLNYCDVELANTSGIEEMHTDSSKNLQFSQNAAILKLQRENRSINLSQHQDLYDLYLDSCDMQNVITPANNNVIYCYLREVTNFTQGFIDFSSSLKQLQLCDTKFESISLKNTDIQCINITHCKFKHIIFPLLVKSVDNFGNSTQILFNKMSMLTRLGSEQAPQMFCNCLKHVNIYFYYIDKIIKKEDFNNKSIKFCPRLKKVDFNGWLIIVEVSRQPEQSQTYCDQILSNLYTINIKSKKVAQLTRQKQIKMVQIAQMLSKMDSIHDCVLSVE